MVYSLGILNVKDVCSDGPRVKVQSTKQNLITHLITHHDVPTTDRDRWQSSTLKTLREYHEESHLGLLANPKENHPKD
jgi:hypothetical protein